MELLERNSYLETLDILYHQASSGEGHTIFVMGEAGIGKTSLVNAFLKQVGDSSLIYVGACDSLFTPTPLGPLYDIARKISHSFWKLLRSETDRACIFASLIQELEFKSVPIVLVFEDVHWADEATLDLIKFLARRISRLNCLFILTYREEEVDYKHPLRIVIGELPGNTFTRMHIQPLSKNAVGLLARRVGYNGEEIFRITGGNPFYVNEILASYSPGIPENIKDSILSVFYRLDDSRVRELWELMSVMPNRIESWLMDLLEPDYAQIADTCFRKGIFIAKEQYIFFKHELYRQSIEETLSYSKRLFFNKKILDILLRYCDKNVELSRLVHHAKNANEREIVAKLAPEAARQAALLGAHIEASRFYMTAIEYSDNFSTNEIANLYECHAYECYLTNQIRSAIVSQKKALLLWKENQVKLKEGNALRFLSRLWWFEGNRKESEALALEAIEVLENGFPTRERAIAYSNLAQLKMLSDDTDQTLHWGNKAIDLAHKLEDNEILCHAFNNVGTNQLLRSDLQTQGEDHLHKSLSLALEYGYHEHVARAYTNLGSSYVIIKSHQKALTALNDGITYCEERDLDSWTYYMLSWKARLHLETGEWAKAEDIARNLLKNPHHPPIVSIGAMVVLGKLLARKGKDGALALLQGAKTMALPTLEVQRIVPVAVALLEFEWINGQNGISEKIVELAHELLKKQNNPWHAGELAFWMYKCNKYIRETGTVIEPYKSVMEGNWKKAALLWKGKNCPYEQAITLFSGTADDQRQAVSILDELGASATCEMLKQKMRSSGIKSIPRGPRQSTRENPAQLTNRQIDVLHLLQDGLQNNEIAEKLFISPKTVDHHISAILSKLEVNSRTKAVAQASKLGILK